MKRNNVKEMLKTGKVVLVPEINHVFFPKVIEILGLLKYQCVWIDMEHSEVGLDQLSNMMLAARAADMDVIVRIGKGGYNSVIRPLELGAGGLVLPHCMDADEAREFVRMAKFAPMGLRGVGGGRDSNYGMTGLNGYTRQANKETLLAVMIEDREAIESIDEIAAVDGIDVLFIGPADLSQSYGVLGKSSHPLVRRAIDKVASASKRHGKSWGLPVRTEKDMRRMVKKGARFMDCVSEMDALIRGFRNVKENYNIAH